MMKFISHSHKDTDFGSHRWFDSETLNGVRFAVRRPSLSQRIELMRRVRDLLLNNDFLASGSEPEKLEAALADLLVRRLYLEWGLAKVEGLRIDGEIATTDTLISCGPEDLAEEIASRVQLECGLSEEERKNS
jgi:hypothetical protein